MLLPAFGGTRPSHLRWDDVAFAHTMRGVGRRNTFSAFISCLPFFAPPAALLCILPFRILYLPPWWTLQDIINGSAYRLHTFAYLLCGACGAKTTCTASPCRLSHSYLA